MRQLSWWRVLKQEEPGMMGVKRCEPWDETERETDARVVSIVREQLCVRVCVCVCVSPQSQVSCTEAGCSHHHGIGETELDVIQI